jgi:hypothetical protein
MPVAQTTNGQSGANIEDSGRSILGLLQKAADMAKEDCIRAMDSAHKLSFRLRAAEERAREAEAEAGAFEVTLSKF